jgi:hypothetical protein
MATFKGIIARYEGHFRKLYNEKKPVLYIELKNDMLYLSIGKSKHLR